MPEHTTPEEPSADKSRADLAAELAALGYDPANYSREAMIERLPGLDAALPGFEAQYGALLNGGSGGQFEGGRFVMLMQFERGYLLVFWNPANPEDKQEHNLFLSREAMMALSALYQLLGDAKRDEAAFLEHAAAQKEQS